MLLIGKSTISMAIWKIATLNYPRVLKIAIEIVDLPTKKDDFP